MDPPHIFLNYYVDPVRRSLHCDLLAPDRGSTECVATDTLFPTNAPRVTGRLALLPLDTTFTRTAVSAGKYRKLNQPLCAHLDYAVTGERIPSPGQG